MKNVERERGITRSVRNNDNKVINTRDDIDDNRDHERFRVYVETGAI
jgi:hypothetical protein